MIKTAIKHYIIEAVINNFKTNLITPGKIRLRIHCTKHFVYTSLTIGNIAYAIITTDYIALDIRMNNVLIYDRDFIDNNYMDNDLIKIIDTNINYVTPSHENMYDILYQYKNQIRTKLKVM